MSRITKLMGYHYERISRWWNNTPMMISRIRKLEWRKNELTQKGMDIILSDMSNDDFKKSVVRRMRRKFDIPNFTVDQEEKAYHTMITELSKEVMVRFASSD